MHKHVGRKNYNICCIYIGGGGITPRPCTVLRRGGYTPHSMYELYVSDLRSQVCIYIYIYIYMYMLDQQTVQMHRRKLVCLRTAD